MNLQLPVRAVPDRANFVKQITPGEPTPFAALDGPGCIRHIYCTTNRTENCSRRVVIRITFDGADTPHVEAPLGDFFGVMHGLLWYPIDSQYLSVQSHNGYNMYFPMPFAREARFEFETPNDEQYVYLQVDWHRYPGEKLVEPKRFCTRWRRENPTERYADDFLVLDADGPGQLAGLVYGVRLIDDADRWSHGGADNIYIDGEGSHPAYIRGTGGEDTFGVAFGGALHAPETHLHAGMPYYVHEDVSQARPAQRLVGYRFFEPDTLPFEESVHMRFGCMRNDICSTVYWYQEAPVRPFVKLPDWDKLMPGTELPRGSCDLELPDCGSWWLCGPFANDQRQAMQAELAPETEFDATATYDGLHGAKSAWLSDRSRELGRNTARWVHRRSDHGFIDFRHVFRPCIFGACPSYPGVALARCVLDADRAGPATLRITWDDQLALRLNDGPVLDLGHHDAFRTDTCTVDLREGPNVVLLKLSNDVATNWGGWAFAFHAETDRGSVLRPCSGA